MMALLVLFSLPYKFKFGFIVIVETNMMRISLR